LSSNFSYKDAFSRNLGWVTAPEQERLRATTVAIAGLGGVGGTHLLTLVRLGIGRFHVADFDVFDFVNFNRQAGARLGTVGRPKVDVMAEMARDINPEVEIIGFPDGVTRENVGAFFDGVDIYVDGLDFFAFDAREMVFAECARRSLPAVTVAPLGMGAALLNFLPGGMTFEQYFGWKGCSDEERALRFFLGLSPAGLTRTYLVDRSAVDFKGRRGPSTPMACEICGGVAATEVLKIVLKRGKVWSAPYGLQFDAYRNKLVRTWRPGGNRHPLQRLALSIARRQFQVQSTTKP
jgi:molybdopterin/thiamine biosynthesis adenylyltransferase